MFLPHLSPWSMVFFIHIMKNNGTQIFTTHKHMHASVKPAHTQTHTHRRTPRPVAGWRANRLCCQLPAFHQTKGWFLSHTQSLNFAFRPLTDPSDYSSESCYGNQGLHTNCVLPLHPDTHSLLLSNLTSPYLHLYSLSETFCLFSRQRAGSSRLHAVGGSRWRITRKRTPSILALCPNSIPHKTIHFVLYSNLYNVVSLQLFCKKLIYITIL